MHRINLLGHTCIGASHISSNKPCQDYSLHKDYGDWQLLIVSDGHGDDKYFRSDKGAKIAVEVTQKAIESFVLDFHISPLSSPLCQRGICGVTDEKSEDYTPLDHHSEDIFRHLFKFIVNNWYQCISEDWNNNPPSDIEFLKADSTGSGRVKSYFDVPNPDIEKAYGCTLIAAVRAKSYWFAFQLGDGKCVAFRDDGSWFEPIPWDSRCFLNKTTSLSGQGAESFRYCYGTEHVPALFIGSDGMDDSYAPMDCLAKWYKLVLYKVLEHGSKKIQPMIEDFLPQLSKQGSKDDMSLQLWIDVDALPDLCKNIYNKDVVEKEELCTQLEEEIANLKTDVFMCENNIEDTERNVEKLADLVNKGNDKVDSIQKSIEKIKQELSSKEEQLKIENNSLNANEKKKQTESNRLENLKKELGSKQASIKSRERQLEQTRQDVESLKETISNNKQVSTRFDKIEHSQQKVLVESEEIGEQKRSLSPLTIYGPSKDFQPFKHSGYPTERVRSLNIQVGEEFSYRAVEHGSVGIWWNASYNEEAFKKSRSFTYNNPKSIDCGEDGGDDAIVVETYTAIRKGKYDVIITHEFRGTIEHTEIFQITIE